MFVCLFFRHFVDPLQVCSRGWGCSSVSRASDRHAADAGSIHPVRQGIFLPESTCSADSLTVSVHPPYAIACINICAHVKNPVVHVRFRRIMETHQKKNTPSMHPKLGRTTLSQLTFPGEGNPNFPWEKSHLDNTVVKSKVKSKSSCRLIWVRLCQPLEQL